MDLLRPKTAVPPPKPKKPLGRYWPEVRGLKDRHDLECVLVLAAKAPAVYPKLYAPLCPPNTYFRVVKKTGFPRSLVTVMPDGLHVVHFTCGACSALSIFNCKCRRGLTVPRSVEFIYDQITALKKGEEWGFHHPDYSGSLRRAEAERTRNNPVVPLRDGRPQPRPQDTRRLLPKGERVEVTDDLDLASLGADKMVRQMAKLLVPKTEEPHEELVIGVTVDPDYDPDKHNGPKRPLLRRK
jgi:hypothetical protein